MTDLGDLLRVPGPEPRKPKRPTHPNGWEPGVAWTPGEGGTITTGPLEAEPDPGIWADLIADWGLDPATTEVVPGTVQVRGWDANVGDGDVRRMRYYKATIRPRIASDARADVEALNIRVERQRARTRLTEASTGRSLVVALADWQLGKGSHGGSAAIVDRIVSALDALPGRIKELARAGRPVESVYLLGLGDLREACSGHYAMQTFETDLDEREQARVIRRLLLRAVDTVAPLVPRVVLGGVPGNHGEKRNGSGKAYTSWTDNSDLEVLEQVGEILSANPARYGHVSVVLADELTMVLDVAGVAVGLAHGHQAKGGIEKWWQGQALGRQAVADAQLLLTGRYHHLKISEATSRTWIQVPAMEGGSEWWTQQTGQHSPPGMLTISVGEAWGPRGWGDLAVLS